MLQLKKKFKNKKKKQIAIMSCYPILSRHFSIFCNCNEIQYCYKMKKEKEKVKIKLRVINYCR